MPEIPKAPDLNTILTWLAAGGGVIILSWAASWGLEGTTWWATLQPKVKSLIILGLSILLGVGATILLQLPNALAFVGKYLAGPVLGSAAVWIVTQYAHGKDPKRTQHDVIK